MRVVDRMRLAVASVALFVPSVVFALNAFISYRERGLVEPYDIPAAVAFFIASVLAWRGSVIGLVGGAALCAIYLGTVVAPGPTVFIAYWVIALVLTVQALPLLRRSRVTST